MVTVLSLLQRLIPLFVQQAEIPRISRTRNHRLGRYRNRPGCQPRSPQEEQHQQYPAVHPSQLQAAHRRSTLPFRT